MEANETSITVRLPAVFCVFSCGSVIDLIVVESERFCRLEYKWIWMMDDGWKCAREIKPFSRGE